MAKRNRSRIKKRRKRHLQKHFNATIKAVPKVKEVPPTKLYLGKYAIENADYQKALESRYNGSVKCIERYINPKAVLRHYCNGCMKQFYARPEWLLGDEYPHDCYGRQENGRRTVTKSSKELGFTWDEFYHLVIEDYTFSQIAKKLRINPQIVKTYFEVNGLI